MYGPNTHYYGMKPSTHYYGLAHHFTTPAFSAALIGVLLALALIAAVAVPARRRRRAAEAALLAGGRESETQQDPAPALVA